MRLSPIRAWGRCLIFSIPDRTQVRVTSGMAVPLQVLSLISLRDIRSARVMLLLRRVIRLRIRFINPLRIRYLQETHIPLQRMRTPDCVQNLLNSGDKEKRILRISAGRQRAILLQQGKKLREDSRKLLPS